MGIWDDGELSLESNSADVLRAVPSEALHDALIAAVSRGWLVGIGGSRDGFSLSLSVIVDGVRQQRWHTTTSTLETALERLLRAASDLSGEPQPKKAEGRSRGRKQSQG